MRAALLGRVRDEAAYSVRLLESDAAPEELVDGNRLPADAAFAFFVRTVPRRDGRARIEADLWSRNSGFIWSREFDLASEEAMIAEAIRIADAMHAALREAFGPVGRVFFVNRGASADYLVLVNGELLGVNVPFAAFAPGRYEVEIRRREAGFEFRVATHAVEVTPSEAVRLTFSMQERAPYVPAYVRLADPERRWRVGFAITSGAYLPFVGDSHVADMMLVSLGTVQFNGVFGRNGVLALEAGHSWLQNSVDEGFRYSIDTVNLLGSVGVLAGPIGGADFAMRVGGGIAGSRFTLGGAEESFSMHAVARGVIEFGFLVGRRGRISTGLASHVIIEGDRPYSWIGFFGGFGGRF